MGDVASAGGNDTARLLVVGAVAAGAACAATALYLHSGFSPMTSSPSKKNTGSVKKGKARKKNAGLGVGGAGAGAGAVAGFDPSAAMSTTSTSSGMTSGAGPVVYEQRRAVDEYIQFHFGKPDDVLPYKDGPHRALSFTARCADLCAKHTKSCRIVRGSNQEGMALDVGCAVGGASFELARHFREVVGIDYSRAFVQTAKLMKERGKLPYTSVKEADITERYEGAVADRIDRNRVTFRQCDACKLPTSLLGGGGSWASTGAGSASGSGLISGSGAGSGAGSGLSSGTAQNVAAYGRHDAVLAANLLCRLPEPAAFLRACAKLVKPGGVLVLVSPYSWLEAWTPRDKWLGGYYDELCAADAAGGAGPGAGAGTGGGGGEFQRHSAGGGGGGGSDDAARLGKAGSSSPSAVGGASSGGGRGAGACASAGAGSPRSRAVRSFDAIHAALTSAEGGFDLVEQTDQPFLIKEHDRKYQWGCSHATVWRRRRESQDQ